ncbi:MAG: hydrogenase maturation protease [gamma proteobacterium symbiont of Taylorina sp.]|nr:hydrogenase maturation protease [gamma proteobacterium symbiont of Taylorina sp.]
MNYIIGMGNVMRSDDGVGSVIIEYIQENDLEDNFCALDFAGNAWGLLPLLNAETEKILIIDCAQMGLIAGNFQFFSLNSIHTQNKLTIENHESSIAQITNLAGKTDYIIPEISIMGIEPESMEFSQQLSTKILSRLTDYAQEAIRFIHTDHNSFSKI